MKSVLFVLHGHIQSKINIILQSSLFYNTKCQTQATQARHDCDTNEMSATRVRYEQYECYKNDTSATQMTRVWHEWKSLILIATRVKTHFHTSILVVWQMRDYRERKNVILRTTFCKCIIPLPRYIWKVHHKNWNL